MAKNCILTLGLWFAAFGAGVQAEEPKESPVSHQETFGIWSCDGDIMFDHPDAAELLLPDNEKITRSQLLRELESAIQTMGRFQDETVTGNPSLVHLSRECCGVDPIQQQQKETISSLHHHINELRIHARALQHEINLNLHRSLMNPHELGELQECPRRAKNEQPFEEFLLSQKQAADAEAAAEAAFLSSFR